MTKRIGIVSIAPGAPDPSGMSFDWYMTRFGRNTGNYMFTQAMFRQLTGELHHLSFDFDVSRIGEEFDHLVIPAANWMNEKSDWTAMADWIEAAPVPVTVIGLGLQASSQDLAEVKVSDSAIRLARVLSSKSPHISVRGDFTRDWLLSIGVRNVVTTGCPSLYMRLNDPALARNEGELVLQSTRYYMTQAFLNHPGTNRDVFGLAGKYDTHMIYQSEFNEIERMVFGRVTEGTPGEALMPALYGLETDADYHAYLARRGHVFCDLDEWSGFLQGTAGVIGTRLHGSILALNSGVPAILIPHDSRTGELVDFAAIPTIHPEGIASYTRADLHAVLHGADIGRFLDTRSRNGLIYRQFLRDCGLDCREENML
ncbi:polysaccharide pyruvyl transferase family protein [Paracoccus mangrovi]|uniref:Polysaccharide pyruvyl transferase family protein n=1 Tax=Paracoccus mangrovi TaxID=1715645 RepID=A0ABV7R8U6_9RHOB